MKLEIHQPNMPEPVEPPTRDEAEGCIQCQIGSKMVLFITGECHWQCDYCPLSENRREIDHMYANERRCEVAEWDAVIEEARAMDATGTGITGGDPMMVRERVEEACKTLKSELGDSHHIHLYTSIPFPPKHAESLAESGLDEIRFHLLDLELERYIPTIAACAETNMNVGIEIPCEPDKEERLYELIEQLRHTSIEFINLNELEITVGNHDNMELRGFNLTNELTAGAEGSDELARAIRNQVNMANLGTDTREPYGYSVKYCTSSYKDSGQLRRRFMRRGEASISPHEQLTDDGTLVFGAIYCQDDESDDFVKELVETCDIPMQFLYHDAANGRIEVPLLLAEGVADEIAAPAAMVEVHPTFERLEVSLIWLNEHRP